MGQIIENQRRHGGLTLARGAHMAKSVHRFKAPFTGTKAPFTGTLFPNLINEKKVKLGSRRQLCPRAQRTTPRPGTQGQQSIAPDVRKLEPATRLRIRAHSPWGGAAAGRAPRTGSSRTVPPTAASATLAATATSCWSYRAAASRSLRRPTSARRRGAATRRCRRPRSRAPSTRATPSRPRTSCRRRGRHRGVRRGPAPRV